LKKFTMTQQNTSRPAPELTVSRWFNTKAPLSLNALLGRVVVLHAFQMLCPGCVSHGTPQAERVHRMFGKMDLTVIGLHTVFEHHAAMTPVSLEAFIHEYRLTYPIGVDEAVAGSPIPATMQRYQLQGTPSLVLIGRDGQIRYQGFGQEDDLALGMRIGTLLAEKTIDLANEKSNIEDGCESGACVVKEE
jgi:peroxiredoxin